MISLDDPRFLQKAMARPLSLARLAGYNQSYFRRVLAGERPAQPAHVHALAKVLGVKPSVLIHESEAEFGEMMDAAAEAGAVAS